MFASNIIMSHLLAAGDTKVIKWGPLVKPDPKPERDREPQPETAPAPAPVPVIAPPVAAPVAAAQAKALITWPAALVQEMNGDSDDWQKANWSNNGPFKNTWRPDNIIFQNGIMSIVLNNQGCPSQCNGKPLASGEYRSANEYGYGFYEARIQFGKGNGLVAGSLFTFTGTYGKKDHHEIDIEPMGYDCSLIQTNHYAGGQGGHEEMIPLGFDGCAEPHNYGFKWAPDELVYYVDGAAVRTVNGSLPSRPGKIMMNLWAGTNEVNGWLRGPFKYNGPVSARYDWVKYSPLDKGPAASAPSPAEASAPAEAPAVKSDTWELVSVRRSGRPGDDGSTQVEIKVRVFGLSPMCKSLVGVIHTDKDYPLNRVLLGGKDEGEFTFHGYLNQANPTSPFHMKMLNANGKVIGKIPGDGSTIPLPFPGAIKTLPAFK